MFDTHHLILIVVKSLLDMWCLLFLLFICYMLFDTLILVYTWQKIASFRNYSASWACLYSVVKKMHTFTIYDILLGLPSQILSPRGKMHYSNVMLMDGNRWWYFYPILSWVKFQNCFQGPMKLWPGQFLLPICTTGQ